MSVNTEYDCIAVHIVIQSFPYFSSVRFSLPWPEVA